MFKLTCLGKHTQYITYVMGKKKKKKIREDFMLSMPELGRKIGEKHIIIHLGVSSVCRTFTSV